MTQLRAEIYTTANLLRGDDLLLELRRSAVHKLDRRRVDTMALVCLCHSLSDEHCNGIHLDRGAGRRWQEVQGEHRARGARRILHT